MVLDTSIRELFGGFEIGMNGEIMKILVNTISTKKNSGGAFQIANNFLLKTLEHPEIEWIYVTSSDLDEILNDNIKRQPYYTVFPTQPDFRHSYRHVKKELKRLEKCMKPDVVYSITAPSYFSFVAPEVMRFTNPTIAHPNKYSWKVLSIKSKLRLVLYSWNQKRMMRKAHYFVTQTETTKKGIIRITGVPDSHVKVVKNVLPTIFSSIDNTHIDFDKDLIDVACVAAPVPHKNLDIIPDVLMELKKRGHNNVRFHVTIPQDSSLLPVINQKLSEYNLADRLVNHGRIPQKDLADMYRTCELCFLPTLLEVFSVSTLEAMFFGLKIVATDFAFNREVMDDACLYYEPMNPSSAAEKLSLLIENKELRDSLTPKMKRQLALYDNYDKHFNDILDFLIKVGKGFESDK